jgi:transcriptional regulator with XRE-family HTH domain
MAAENSSARLLGAELRGWRDRRGLTGDAVAGRLRWSPSKVSRGETATTRLIRAADLDKLIVLYRIPPEDADRLRGLREAAADGLDMTGPGQDPRIAELLIWAPDVFPSAFRTELYARALIRAMRRIRRYTPSEIKAEITADRDLQARLRGDRAADNDGDPLPRLPVTCVLDEAVLTRRRGATSVMEGQLGRLEEMARLGGVEIHVLPLEADGPTSAPFALHGYDDESADTVLLTSPSGTEYVTDEKAVTSYRFLHEDLVGAAADVEETLAIIKQARGRWE